MIGAIRQRLSQGLSAALIRGVAYSYGGLVVSGLLSTAVQSLILRQLGPEGYGSYTLLLTSLLFISLVLGFGLDTWVLKQGGTNPAALTTIVWEVLILKLGGVAIVLAGLQIGLIGNAHYAPAFLLGLAATAANTFGQTVYAALRTRRANGQVAVFQVLEQLIVLLALLAAGRSSPSITLIMGVRLACTLAITIALFYRLQRLVGPLQLRPAPLRALRGAWLYLTSDTFAITYQQAPIYILGAASGALAVGILRPAIDLISVLYTVPTLAFFVALPLLSSPKLTRADFVRLVRLLLVGAALFGVATIIGVALVGRRALQAFTGAEYAESYTFLLLLSPMPLIKSFNLVTAAIILARDKIWMRVIAQGLIALLCVLLGLAIIPALGSTGAALLIVATELIILAIYTAIALVAYRSSRFEGL